MNPAGQRLRTLAEIYAVCRLAPASKIPDWAKGEFFSVTSTVDEVSVICPAKFVPAGIQTDGGWRVLKVIGPFPFSTVGVLSSLAAPLAQAQISLLTVATFDTDYLLVKDKSLQAAVTALAAAGHQVE